MRVLVTGAAGPIGTAVLAHLAERGIPVTAPVLSPVPGLLADRVVVGNAADPAAVEDAVRDVTDLIHLAAIPTPSYPDIVREIFPGAPVIAAGYARPSTAPGRGVTWTRSRPPSVRRCWAGTSAGRPPYGGRTARSRHPET
jgi:uncharacterized protein YbjT (DUF2867 family)